MNLDGLAGLLSFNLLGLELFNKCVWSTWIAESSGPLHSSLRCWANRRRNESSLSLTLKTKGKLILEIDDKQKNITNKILKQNKKFRLKKLLLEWI